MIINDKPEDIAGAAVKLLTDKILYKKIAENAKRKVFKKYDWDPIAKNLSHIYEDLGRK